MGAEKEAMIMNMKRVAGVVAAMCLLLAAGGFALAHGPGQGGPPEPPNAQEMERQVAEKLSSLVTGGTISQDESAKVMELWQQKDRERQADFERMKGMSPDERKAFMDANRKDRPDMIGELVSKAGLTEAQAKAVAEALRPPGPPPDNR